MGKADRFEEIAGSVHIDLVALLEIEFRFPGDDCREMEDHIGTGGDQAFCCCGF